MKNLRVFHHAGLFVSCRHRTPKGNTMVMATQLLPKLFADLFKVRPGENTEKVNVRMRELVGKARTALDAASTVDKNFDAMTIKDLQALAAEEETDLRGARSWDEMIWAIKAALVAV
jgi:hypothetical protein